MSGISEALVEKIAADWFVGTGCAVLIGVEIDNADSHGSARSLLAKFGYPPDLAEDATQLVLRQAELSTASVG